MQTVTASIKNLKGKSIAHVEVKRGKVHITTTDGEVFIMRSFTLIEVTQTTQKDLYARSA